MVFVACMGICTHFPSFLNRDLCKSVCLSRGPPKKAVVLSPAYNKDACARRAVISTVRLRVFQNPRCCGQTGNSAACSAARAALVAACVICRSHSGNSCFEAPIAEPPVCAPCGGRVHTPSLASPEQKRRLYNREEPPQANATCETIESSLLCCS